MGGALSGDKFVHAFYENPGFGKEWISLDLVGAQSNRSAIGAVIHLIVEEGAGQRNIYKHVNSGGSFGANPFRQAIGLGDARTIKSLGVHWPTSGVTQIFEGIEPNRFYRVTEGKKELESLHLKKFAFGSNQEN
jgi:hypothetical protein